MNEDILFQLKGSAKGPFARNEWAFAEGRHWAIVGSDGEAKSRLCAMVAEVAPPPHGVHVEFADGLEDRVQIVSFAQQRAAAKKGGFMQARYYSLVDDAGPGDTVEEVLDFNRIFDVNPFEVGRPLKKERRAYSSAFRRVMRLLNLGALLDRDFLALSNGETRRVLLARALLANPRVLVLDDPCAGLDSERREQVKKICDALAARGISLLVSVRHADEIPSCVTDVMTIENGRITQISRKAPSTSPAHTHEGQRNAPGTPGLRSICVDSGADLPPVIEIRDLKISFGRRKLFDGLTWVVRKGERWVLRGANGSGKTTLLSLVIGDNPQAYANDVTVFGQKRGPGMELAKIRRRIGMVSPELQAYTGDTAEELLEAALRRKPSLLLLDEPCLNLDEHAADKLKRRVDCWLNAHPGCTAICVAHRPEDVPQGFSHTLALS